MAGSRHDLQHHGFALGLKLRRQVLAVHRPDRGIAGAVQQKERRLVAIDEIHRLRPRPILFRAEHRLDLRIDDWQEVVGTRESDHACQIAWAHADRRQILGIGRQKGGDLPAGGMAHHEYPGRIAAIATDVGAGPGDGRRGIAHEDRKRIARCLSVIGNDHNHAALGQRLADKPVILALPVAPTAAVEKHDHRRRPVSPRPVHVELLVGAWRIARGLASRIAVAGVDRPEINLAATGEQRDGQNEGERQA